jgi:transporter family protein
MSEDWRVFAFASAVFAALTAILAKVGVSEINSDAATAYRTAVVLIMAVLIVLVRHEWPSSRWSIRAVIFLTLSGIATGCSWLCYFRALKLGPASRVAPIDKLSVVIVVLLAAALLGERLTLKSAFASALITTGAILLAF